MKSISPLSIGVAAVAAATCLSDGAGIAVTPDDARDPDSIGLIAQQAYLKASNTGPGDRFGRAVAVSGDTVIVGAYREDSNAAGINSSQTDNGAPDSGAVYVFVRSGGTWRQQAYLKASNTGADDRFGRAVAISGDTVVVGAYGEDSSSNGIDGNQVDNSSAQSGAAYVFVRSGDTWTQQAYLKASNTGANDEFGCSVAVSGDMVVVGARFESGSSTGVNGNQATNGAARSGAAYVFVRKGTSWFQEAYLKASNTGAEDMFASSLAISGDTVVVGAPNEDSAAIGSNGSQTNNSSADSGAAYVFTRSGGTWSQQAYLKAGNTGPGDQFGWSVAASGDTLLIGACGESSSATGVNGNQTNNGSVSSGAAYVFTRSGVTWRQQAYLKASNTGANDDFGWATALSGDTAVVGATGEDGNAAGVNGSQTNNVALNSGAAYVFGRAGDTWSQRAYVKASNPAQGEWFGWTVAVSGESMVVGAYGEDSNATGINGNQGNNRVADSGAAYVFDLNAPAVPEIAVQQPAGFNLTGGSSNRLFGSVRVGSTSMAKTFTVRNTGTAVLRGLAITKSGSAAAEFAVGRIATTSLAPGAQATFRVTFKPTRTGTRRAAIHISSNDSDENPFDIQLGGFGVR